MLTCFKGDFKIVKMFVDYFKIDINKKDIFNRNGFYYAC